MRPIPFAALSLAAVLIPPPARPADGPACHCFQDRAYDAARPAAADPYLLATTRSSLLSAAFGIPKANLVREVMMGTQSEDLWIASWAGARLGRGSDELLEAKSTAGSWKAVLGGQADRLGAEFRTRLARGDDDGALAAAAVDDVLVSRARADRAAVARLRAAGAGSEEVILATFLGARLRAAPVALLEPVRAGRTTWGKTLHSAGLVAKDLDRLVRQSVR